jgi:hypothetical protein
MRRVCGWTPKRSETAEMRRYFGFFFISSLRPGLS